MEQITSINFILPDEFNKLPDNEKRILINIYLNLWVALGLNKSIEYTVIVETLKKILNIYISSQDNTYYPVIEFYIKKIFVWRKYNIAFLNKIFDTVDEDISLICIKIICEYVASNIISPNKIDINSYFNIYESKFGFNKKEYINEKLSYYTITNINEYEKNIDMINDLCMKLNNVIKSE